MNIMTSMMIIKPKLVNATRVAITHGEDSDMISNQQEEVCGIRQLLDGDCLVTRCAAQQ